MFPPITITNLIEYGQSCCPCFHGTDEEKIKFARYERFEDDQELEVASGWTDADNDDSAIATATNNNTDERDNTISEWQAGWNVTNAIQARK